jgi:hypothetical protein
VSDTGSPEPLVCLCSYSSLRKKLQITILVLTQPGIELMIYHTQIQYANYLYARPEAEKKRFNHESGMDDQ